MAKINNQLNANTTSQKGLEKAIGNTLRFVTNAQSKTNALLYGKGETKNPNSINRALDKGIIPVLEELSSADLCNIINYLISQSGNKPTFNPNKRPEGGFELDKWNIQNEAFQAQLAIDNYFGRFSDALSPNARNGLIDLLGVLNPSILRILSTESGINSGPFQNAFPQTKIVAQALTKASNFFNSTLSSIGLELGIAEAQKVIDLIQKIRVGLILIQGLNSPANILAATDLALGGRVQSEIARINRLIPVDKLIPFLKSILKTANNVNSIGRKILSLIDTSKFFVRLILLIIKALTILKNVLLFVPLPNVFTTLGITTKVANTLEEFLNRRGVITLTQRLQQLNYVLNVMSIFVTSLVTGINEVIIRLRLILLNLQTCQNQNIDNLDPSLQQDIINTINNLSSTRDSLQKFLDDYNNAKKSTQTTFGEYTIEIVTEELTDEGISLKRRYGIARNNQNVIVVQTLPTFASLDLIIINEVKVLLVSKGLVLQGVSTISTEDAAIIVESLNYLGDPDITLDNLQNETTNISLALTEADSELELGKFVSNLPGGRALRKKVREKLIKTNESLVKELKSTDPNSTYTKSIVKEKQDETTKLRIEKLEDQKEDLKKSLLLTGAVPGSSIAIIAKIKAIDQEIKDLKNSLK